MIEYKTKLEALYRYLDKVLNEEPDYQEMILNDIDGTYYDIDYLRKQFEADICESRTGYYFPWENDRD